MINSFDKEYAFLSNFYPSLIGIHEENGPLMLYTTVEHAFQAGKTTDLAIKRQIGLQPTPGKAKRLGRIITLRSDWEEIKIKRMEECVHDKFQIPFLQEKLLATGNQELVEGNFWHDNFWGDCQCEKCQHIVGQNHLGKILMAERKRICQEET